jgi:hypothetical protein
VVAPFVEGVSLPRYGTHDSQWTCTRSPGHSCVLRGTLGASTIRLMPAMCRRRGLQCIGCLRPIAIDPSPGQCPYESSSCWCTVANQACYRMRRTAGTASVSATATNKNTIMSISAGSVPLSLRCGSTTPAALSKLKPRIRPGTCTFSLTATSACGALEWSAQAKLGLTKSRRFA